MIIDPTVVLSSLIDLIPSVAVSLAIALLSCFVGVLGGFPLGLLLTTHSILRDPANLYVLLISTPNSR